MLISPYKKFSEAVIVSLILSSIIFAINWRYNFNWSDEGLLWYLSQRVQLGEYSIRDFFGYDPGRYLWSAAWFKVIGGDGLFEQRLANAIFGAIGLGAAYAVMAACQVKFITRLVTISVLAITLGFPRHKIYEQSLSLIAISLLAYCLFSPKKPTRWLLFGLSTGLAAIIGRNSGLYYVLAAIMGLAFVWRTQSSVNAWKGFLSFFSGVIIGYTPFVFCLILDHQYFIAFKESILFTPHWQLPLSIPFPWRIHQDFLSFSGIQKAAVSWLCVLVIFIYILATLKILYRIIKHYDFNKLNILEIASLFVGLPYLHHAFDRADFSHIAQGILAIFLLITAQLIDEPTLVKRKIYTLVLCLSLVAWIPVQPFVRTKLLTKNNIPFNFSGKTFVIDNEKAQVLTLSKREFENCKAGDGQFIAMPYYPGIFAYLHTRSPYWEMYFLYKRTEEFQLKEIDEIRKWKSKIAIINTSATVDKNVELRIDKTNPILVDYIRNNFKRIDFSTQVPLGFEVYERSCKN